MENQINEHFPTFGENVHNEGTILGRTLDRIKASQRERSMSTHTLQSLHSLDDQLDSDDSDGEDPLYSQNHLYSVPPTPGRISSVPSLQLLSSLNTVMSSSNLSEKGSTNVPYSVSPVTSSLPPPPHTPVEEEPVKRTVDLPEYRRLYISEIADDFDRDTITACKEIKLCLDLRKKWLDMHPTPPQDLADNFDLEHQIHQDRRRRIEEIKKANSVNNFQTGMSNSPLQSSTKGFSSNASNASLSSSYGPTQDPPKEYRRRLEPPYEVFDIPIPENDPNIFFNMVNGVMMVRKLSVDEQNTYRNNFAAKNGLTRARSKSKGNEEEDDAGNLYMSSDDEEDESDDIITNLHDLDLTSSTLSTGSVMSPSTKRGGINSMNMSMILDFNKTDYPVHSFQEFVEDLNKMTAAVFGGPVSTFAYKRLKLLIMRFNFHILLNDSRELEMQKLVPHRDFYNVRKVDTHVHHSACMNQKHLLKFIKHKLKHNADEAVIFRDGRFLTLGEVFKSLNLTAYDLSIDTLDMHANNTFHRFDRFNLKYNPAGQSRLREIFLKTENVIGGRYLAEITKEMMNELQANKYQMVEWRISIYGRKSSEWSSLARWFYMNRLAHPNVRWLIQIPRLYDVYKKSGEVNNFGEMLNNIFQPLFAVSVDPSSNPPLHYFLQTVVGIDSVDDESKPDLHQLNSSTPTPEQWDLPYNPPFGYWMYYMYANLVVLNKLRADRGLNTFQFRPHCGEAGSVDHLIHTFLTGHQINHGINLRLNSGLQYLYYLTQIGIAMSPLSNNKLFLDYNKNPFLTYFQQGLNVSLSTDDPLMLHYTKDALLEEYSVAAQVWKLSAVDQCEIARNSVLQSGWSLRYKKRYLGSDLKDIRETNVPLIRLNYREEVLKGELSLIEDTASVKSSATASAPAPTAPKLSLPGHQSGEILPPFPPLRS